MFYGQQLQDKFIFERYFPQKKNGLMIEAGAFDGILETCSKFFEDSMGWDCINIEAYPWAYEKLIINRPNCTNLGIGLSNKTHELEFLQYNHPTRGPNFGNGSFSHVSWHKDELINSNCTPEKFLVKCARYDEVVDEIVASRYHSREIDLFVLDVEGYELFVIEGMKNSKFLPKIMCVEYPMSTIPRLDVALGELGYSLDITHNNNAMYVRP